MVPLKSLLFRPWLTLFFVLKYSDHVQTSRSSSPLQWPPVLVENPLEGGGCLRWFTIFQNKKNVSEGRNKRLVNGLEDSRRGSHHTSRNSCADVWLGPTKLLLFSVQAQGHFMKELFSVHWKSWWISAGFCHSRWRVSKWILWTEKTIAIRSVYRGHF